MLTFAETKNTIATSHARNLVGSEGFSLDGWISGYFTFGKGKVSCQTVTNASGGIGVMPVPDGMLIGGVYGSISGLGL